MRRGWLFLLTAAAVACSSGSTGGSIDGGGSLGGGDGGTGSGQAPPGATATVPVSVPSSMQSAPFDVPRSLTVPPGFAVAVYARVPGARFIAVTPEGNLLVSNPSAGKVSLVRSGTGGGGPVVSDWVTGLRLPHDLVFHTIAGTPWLYVSESNAVRRYAW